MHPILKYIVNSIVDDKPIQWDELRIELDNTNLSDREKRLVWHLEVIHKTFKLEPPMDMK